ncbi:hypothetical protein [Treponema sp. R6D11]
MKKTLLIIGLLMLTVTMVFAQAKPPKAKKIIDKNVSIQESAILYFPNESFVLMFDETKFGVVGPLSTMNLKGAGGQNASQYKIANPILQVPAGKHSVVATVDQSLTNTPNGCRKITYNFQPGHYYQMATVFNKVDVGEATKQIMKDMFTKGIDWCFIDITDEVNAGKKDYKEKWEAMNKNGEMGKDQVSQVFSLGKVVE